MPKPPPRDLRLDVLRGWMQLSIFVSHIVGTQLSWGIHAAWGPSDSSEQFLFLSGLALGSVWALKAARAGERAAQRDLLGRTRRLWGTHLKLFLGFLLLVTASAWAWPALCQVDALGWRWLMDHPLPALPAALLGLHQPRFMGILPSFIWSMLLLGPFMALRARVGEWALLPSFALWLGVQRGWWAMPGVGPDGIAFDPLAWQFLYMIGATLGARALHGQALPLRRPLLAGAALVVGAGFVQALAHHGFVAAPFSLAHAHEMKEALPPFRLLHALALALLVSALVPRGGRWLGTAPARLLAAIGARSLRVFCGGLFLAVGASAILAAFPAQRAWLDPLLVLGGAALLGLLALLPPPAALIRPGWRRGGSPRPIS